MAEPQKVTIGYWGFRGAAQCLRNLAAYLSIPFEDKLYTDADSWFKQDKPSLKTDFPNLPYLIDGERVLTESEAIAVYFVFRAGKVELLGGAGDERVRLAQIRGVYYDTRKALYEIAFNKAVADPRKAFEEKVLPKIQLLSKHLGNNEFLLGKLTIIDFYVAETLAWIKFQDGDWLETVPNFKEYVDRVASLPGVKEYLEKGTYPQVFMNPMYVNEKIKI